MKRRRLLLVVLVAAVLATLLFAVATSSSPPPLQANFVRAATNSAGELFYQMTVANSARGTVDVWHCSIDMRYRINGIHHGPMTVAHLDPLPPQATALMLFPAAKKNPRQAHIRYRTDKDPWALGRQIRAWFKTRRWPTRLEVARERELFVDIPSP
jgi:hypothetical protein